MKSKFTKYLENFFIIAVSLLFLVFFILQVTSRDEFSPWNNKVEILKEDAGLLLEDGTVIPIEEKDGYFMYADARPGETLTVVMRLPEIDRQNRVISVFSTEQDVGIYIDGVERIYYNDEEYRLAGSYSASRFVMVPVYEEDSGHELRVTYKTSVALYAGSMACPKYAREQDMLYWIFLRYAGQITSAVILLAVGIIFILFSVVLRYKRRDDKGIGYLGIFSIIIAVWLLCQSNMRVFYSSYLSGVNLMAFYMIIIIPIPILMFFNNLMKYRYQKHINLMIVITILNTIMCLALEFMGIADTITTIPIAHVIITVCCVICLTDFCRYMKSGDIVEPFAMILGMGCFFSVVLIEEINLLFFNWFFVGKYIGYGTLFFMICFGYAAFRSSEEQEREYREAVRANKIKSDFLGNMSHEIRTPISTILGMNEMILNESDNREIIGYARNIRNAGNILLALVNDVLDFAKIEAGKMEITPVRYELRNMLNDLMQTIGTRASMKGLAIELDVEKTTPNILYGDEIRIRQAVTNLLTNAVKYTQKGGITLKVRYVNVGEEELRLYISVSDTGIGIRKEDQNRLFQSFVRLDENRNRSIEGTGLGLAITSHIIRSMNGNIELESEYGKGTTFTISFLQKIVDNAPVGDFEDWYRYQVRRPRQYLEQYEAEDVQLLLVDDNVMNLEVIKGLLGKTGAVIDAVASGRECLELVKKKNYDLILMDHMMPDMDGIETFQKIQESRPKGGWHTPVIALTANAVSGAREEYLRCGFADYIAKPVEYKKLIETMKKFLPDKIKLRTEVANTQILCEDYLERKEIHVQEALKYTAGDFDQYIHLLELFTMDKDRVKQQALTEAYEQFNWKNYVTYVHGLKNCARMIGADDLADMAYEHECKGREHDKKFLKQNFHILLDKWNHTEDIIHEYLERNFNSENEKGSAKPGLSDEEWGEIRDKIAAYLDVFKKKEALGLLVSLDRYELDARQQQTVEEAVKAVKSYDYERAIMLLRQYELH